MKKNIRGEEVTEEQIAQYEKDVKESHELVESLKNDTVKLKSFLEEFSDDITDSKEGESYYIDEQCGQYSIYEMTNEQKASVFEGAFESDYFTINLKTLRSFANLTPVRIKPVLKNRYNVKFNDHQKKVRKELMKEIDCIMIHYTDASKMTSSQPATLRFQANILYDRDEEWTIPSQIPIRLPIYVLMHFAKSPGQFSRQRKDFYESKRKPQESVMNDLAETSGKSVLGYSMTREEVLTETQYFVMFYPLSKIESYCMLGAI